MTRLRSLPFAALIAGYAGSVPLSSNSESASRPTGYSSIPGPSFAGSSHFEASIVATG